MAFANAIDLNALLQIISDEAPQGEDIRDDRSPTSDYYTIKDARNSARAAERSAMFEESDTDLMAPWRVVAKTAEKILKEKSKDLEVASWYTEALIRLHGFTGLRDGLALIEHLIANHWDGLYPEPDEDGIETKVAPLTGLNGDGADGTLLMPIRNADITQEGDLGAYSLFHYQQARDAEKIADEEAKAARLETLGYGIAEINQCVNAASPEWASDLVETLEDGLALYKSIGESLRNRCGQDAPPSSSINDLMNEVLRTARFIYKSQLDAINSINDALADVGISAEKTEVSENTTKAMTLGNVNKGAISSREDALVLLDRAAKYFRTYEPHTPLAPGLERLVSWGRMTVSELMTELLPDDQSRAMYSQLTGVKLDGTDSQRYSAPPVISPVSNNSNVSSVESKTSQDSDEWDESQKNQAAETSW